MAFRPGQDAACQADLLVQKRSHRRRFGRNGVAVMQHVEAPDLLAAYALDALPEGESAPLLAHIRQCAACRRDLAVLLTAVSALPLTLQPIAPPSELRQRLLARAVQAHDLSANPLPKRRVLLNLERRFGGWLAAAALLLASLGLGGWGLLEHDQLGANAPIALAATDRGAGAAGEVGLVSGQMPSVSVSGLAAPQNGKVYEAWIVHGGVPQAAGVFVTSVGGTGGVVLTMRPMPGDQLVITLEPALGDTTPAGPALLEGPATA